MKTILLAAATISFCSAASAGPLIMDPPPYDPDRLFHAECYGDHIGAPPESLGILKNEKYTGSYVLSFKSYIADTAAKDGRRKLEQSDLPRVGETTFRTGYSSIEDLFVQRPDQKPAAEAYCEGTMVSASMHQDPDGKLHLSYRTEGMSYLVPSSPEPYAHGAVRRIRDVKTGEIVLSANGTGTASIPLYDQADSAAHFVELTVTTFTP